MPSQRSETLAQMSCSGDDGDSVSRLKVHFRHLGQRLSQYRSVLVVAKGCGNGKELRGFLILKSVAFWPKGYNKIVG